MIPLPPSSTLFPYTTLFRSVIGPGDESRAERAGGREVERTAHLGARELVHRVGAERVARHVLPVERQRRSEEHTSELQSRLHLVCRLLLEKKKQKTQLKPVA